MNWTILNDLERQARRLSTEERLWLIERLASGLRQTSGDLGQELAAMAADPEIQRELREINEEFAAAEGDGLEQPE